VKTAEEKLNISERKIYGPSCVNDAWRAKYNDELCNLYEEPSMVKVIKIGRLKWLGHEARTDVNASCRKTRISQPGGSRKKCRPKLRWLDSVLKDMKTLS
jgi:hypothetical protein